MRNVKDIPIDFPRDRASAYPASEVDALAAELDTNGIVVLPGLLNALHVTELHSIEEAGQNDDAIGVEFCRQSIDF